MVCATTSIDQFFLCVLGAIVFFMQAGFAMLEAGGVGAKNVTNIMFKNSIDACFGAIMFWSVGYAFAYGPTTNGFIGNKFFFLSELDLCDYAGWFYQFTFAATASTIVSGAVAERCTIIAYLMYTVLITGSVYPVVVHWAWNADGWLLKGDGDGAKGGQFIDFAGSGVVHLTGGAAALAGAYFLGPRLCLQDKNAPKSRGHSMVMTAAGAFILGFGFLAFNGGSVLRIDDADGTLGSIMALSVVNTVLAAAAGSLTSVAAQRILARMGRSKRAWSLYEAINGGLAGQVAICAGAASMRPWAAVVVGIIAALAVRMWVLVMSKAKIDDPLSAAAVHLGAGIWGLLAKPIFEYEVGILYSGSEVAFRNFAWHLCGVVAIFVWSFGLCGLLFFTLGKFGLLRVSEEHERHGLDFSEHGEQSYTFDIDVVLESGKKPVPTHTTTNFGFST